MYFALKLLPSDTNRLLVSTTLFETFHLELLFTVYRAGKLDFIEYFNNLLFKVCLCQ